MEEWMAAWSTLLKADRVSVVAVLAAYLVWTGIETLVPAEPGQGLRGRARNLLYFALFKVLGLFAIAGWIVFGPTLPIPARDPSPIGLVGLVLGNLFVTDFIYYWYHRAQHRFTWLWAVHELHHADAELNVTTSYRTYWLDALIQTILIATPTALLFGNLGPNHVLAVVVIAQFFLLFTHANIRLGLGPLSGTLCGPQVHRIHHSRLEPHRDRNFAQIFTFIDRMFGTYYAPARDEYPPTGAPGLASDARVAKALSWPFIIWARELGLSARR